MAFRLKKNIATDQNTYPKSVDVIRAYANRTIIRALAILVKTGKADGKRP